MKTALFVVLRVIALTIVLSICVAVAGGVVGLQNSQSSDQAGAAMLTLLAVCFLQVAAMTHLILRSRWTGWRLVATVFVVFYGVMTFMPQIESAVFLTRLPPGTVPRLLLMGLLIAAPFSVLSVVILGKRKGVAVDGSWNCGGIATERCIGVHDVRESRRSRRTDADHAGNAGRR